MAEELVLTNPIIPPTNDRWRVRRLDKSLDGEYIHVELKGTNGERWETDYRGSIALSFIRTLNKSNNSVKSEERRVIEKLQQDFPELSGTIQGSPD